MTGVSRGRTCYDMLAINQAISFAVNLRQKVKTLLARIRVFKKSANEFFMQDRFY